MEQSTLQEAGYISNRSRLYVAAWQDYCGAADGCCGGFLVEVKTTGTWLTEPWKLGASGLPHLLIGSDKTCLEPKYSRRGSSAVELSPPSLSVLAAASVYFVSGRWRIQAKPELSACPGKMSTPMKLLGGLCRWDRRTPRKRACEQANYSSTIPGSSTELESSLSIECLRACTSHTSNGSLVGCKYDCVAATHQLDKAESGEKK